MNIPDALKAPTRNKMAITLIASIPREYSKRVFQAFIVNTPIASMRASGQHAIHYYGVNSNSFDVPQLFVVGTPATKTKLLPSTILLLVVNFIEAFLRREIWKTDR